MDDSGITIYHGDAWDVVKALPDESVQTVVTSPPYWGLRDYGSDGQFGLESTPEEYVAKLVALFADIRRVLKDDGTVWLNLGDSYAGGGGHSPNAPSSAHSKSGLYGKALKEGGIPLVSGLKPKDLVGIPWRVAFALQGDGWYLRSDIIWSKPNPIPESVTDRPTKAHEYIFLLSKSERYYYDHEAIKEPSKDPGRIVSYNGTQKNTGHDNIRYPGQSGPRDIKVGDSRNKRSVWTVSTKPYKDAHFATFPPDLIEPCILAGAPKHHTVLDPFHGSGTTGEVCRRAGRTYIGIELNAEYIEMSMKRFRQQELF